MGLRSVYKREGTIECLISIYDFEDDLEFELEIPGQYWQELHINPITMRLDYSEGQYPTWWFPIEEAITCRYDFISILKEQDGYTYVDVPRAVLDAIVSAYLLECFKFSMQCKDLELCDTFHSSLQKSIDRLYLEYCLGGVNQW